MNDTFIGRTQELKLLEQSYSDDRQKLIILYGRRRIGKTVLLRHFFEGKRGIWLTGFEGNKDLLFSSLCNTVNEFFPTSDGTNRSFIDINEVLSFLFKRSIEDKYIFVIDEFPYLANVFPEIPTLLQMYLDQYKETGKLKLVLSGSSMHFMEHQILSKESPLYGRRDLSIKLKPFGISEVKQMLGSKALNDDVFKVWSITGGVPLYVSLFKGFKDISTAVKELFFEDNGYFANEVSNIFLMEFRFPRNYETVCTLLSSGTNKVSDIASKSRLSTPLVSSVLTTLQDLDIVEQEFSISPSKRKPIWKIKDPLIRFWYKFRYPLNAYTAVHMEAYFKEHFSEFLGDSFEAMCRSVLPMLFPDELIIEIGRWWGGNPKTKKEEEIDIAARTINGNLIVAECKYTSKKVSQDILQTLKDRALLISDDSNVKCVLFSKSGFCSDLEVQDNLILYTFDEVMDFLIK